MRNDQMKAGRFLAWQNSRKKIAWIKSHLEAGRTVYICTYTRATKIRPKLLKEFDAHFKATKSGAYISRGKAWDCFDGSGLKAVAE